MSYFCISTCREKGEEVLSAYCLVEKYAVWEWVGFTLQQTGLEGGKREERGGVGRKDGATLRCWITNKNKKKKQETQSVRKSHTGNVFLVTKSHSVIFGLHCFDLM